MCKHAGDGQTEAESRSRPLCCLVIVPESLEYLLEFVRRYARTVVIYGDMEDSFTYFRTYLYEVFCEFYRVGDQIVDYLVPCSRIYLCQGCSVCAVREFQGDSFCCGKRNELVYNLLCHLYDRHGRGFHVGVALPEVEYFVGKAAQLVGTFLYQ